jgi:hypothetical protein
LLLSKPES